MPHLPLSEATIKPEFSVTLKASDEVSGMHKLLTRQNLKHTCGISSMSDNLKEPRQSSEQEMPDSDVAIGEGTNMIPLSCKPKKCADHCEDVDATQKNQNEQFFDCKADDESQDPPIEVEGASEDPDLEHAHSLQIFPQAQNVAITNSNIYTVSSGSSIVFGEPSKAVNSVHHHHHYHHHYYRQNRRRRLGRRFSAD